jgi:hypothetical protein
VKDGVPGGLLETRKLSSDVFDRSVLREVPERRTAYILARQTETPGYPCAEPSNSLPVWGEVRNANS